MPKHDINDTIAAISTAVGEAGIGIVRISGKDALNIADKIFSGKSKPSSFRSYTTHYGLIKSEDKVVDEVILTVMRSPRSYTKEDVVEINCHGGIIALRDCLDLVLAKGARLAEPGEFTKRAFLNGRIDLAQAEAVIDIIRAKTDSSLRIGLEQLKGSVSDSVNKMRDSLVDILSVLEASIDFPEEESGTVELSKLSQRMRKIDDELKAILEGSRRGRVFREGIHVVICGKPNVGKSSLLNALLKQERSIVTSVAGTTRDTIEEIIDIRGIPVRIVDTAGILEPRDLVEKKAVERSKKHIQQADLAIIIFDASRNLSKEDELLIRKLKGKQAIAIANKMDLKPRLDKKKLIRIFGSCIDISAKKGKNIYLLEEEIVNRVYKGKVASPEPLLVGNLRQIQSLRQAEILIAQALASLDNRLTPELVCQDIRDALGSLDELLGRKFSEELLDKIFSEFCIGK
jgi:tRNA modification GTPase